MESKKNINISGRKNIVGLSSTTTMGTASKIRDENHHNDTNDVNDTNDANDNNLTDVIKTTELLNNLLYNKTTSETDENYEYNSELSYELYSYSDDENDDTNCAISK